MGPSFTLAAGPRQRSHSQVPVPRDSWPYFTVPDSRLPQLGGSVPRIYIPHEHHEQGGPVIPPGSLLVAVYDSQGYGGGIWTRLHMGVSMLLATNILRYIDLALTTQKTRVTCQTERSLALYQHWAWRWQHRKHFFCCQNVCLLARFPALGIAQTT
jgi:hypothetical protein